MNNIDKYNYLLGRAGLSESEKEVYLTGLKLGTCLSSTLIKTLKMPRPTLLAALAQLQELGLCRASRNDGRSYNYTMQPADNLKSALGRKIRELEDIASELDELKMASSSTIVISEAQGMEEVQDILELALRCESRKWQIIAPKKNALKFMPKKYTDYFKKIRAERQIESQSLWEFNSSQHLALRDILMRKPRYVPENISTHIPSLILAFDDSLLVIDINDLEVPTASLIRNQSIADTFRIVFEMAWRSARSQSS